MHVRTYLSLSLTIGVLAACSSHDSTTSPSDTTKGTSFSNNPCSVSGTLTLAVDQTSRVDCSNGGTTVTLAGNGASYAIVAQFPVDLVANQFVPYHVSSGTSVTASRIPILGGLAALRASMSRQTLSGTVTSKIDGQPRRNRARQLAFDHTLRTRARQQLASGKWGISKSLTRTASASMSPAARASTITVPAVGSIRAFHVTDTTGTLFKTVNARLAYSGSDVLIYIDTLSPANGFTDAQLQTFGQLFDQTLYPIDTAAFGPPTDIDQNGHVIMLMSPAVNALSPSSQCSTLGYVAGFFDEVDLVPSESNSNDGEIFYSIVPDPSGTASCAHTVDDVGFDVPSTFMHELQHLISFAQHVVVHGGSPEFGWLDEGLSINAEELGSLYYENKFPPPTGRKDPSQIFPDSSQGFINDFLYDSYQYALLPDTASVTLHDDSENGFSWRGGDWLLMHYLKDQFGLGVFKKLDQNTATGVANIVSSTGEQFPSLFADFGLSLYTDSLPGLPRNTAPAADRFVTRNVKLLWNRLFQTSPGTDVPTATPLVLFPISSDTTTNIMYPGTGSYWRLDTPANAATVTIQFSGPGGAVIPSNLKPQLSIFRLPPGQ